MRVITRPDKSYPSFSSLHAFMLHCPGAVGSALVHVVYVSFMFSLCCMYVHEYRSTRLMLLLLNVSSHCAFMAHLLRTTSE